MITFLVSLLSGGVNNVVDILDKIFQHAMVLLITGLIVGVFIFFINLFPGMNILPGWIKFPIMALFTLSTWMKVRQSFPGGG